MPKQDENEPKFQRVTALIPYLIDSGAKSGKRNKLGSGAKSAE